MIKVLTNISALYNIRVDTSNKLSAEATVDFEMGEIANSSILDESNKPKASGVLSIYMTLPQLEGWIFQLCAIRNGLKDNLDKANQSLLREKS